MSEIHHDCLTLKELHIVDEAGRTKVFISTDPEHSMPYMQFRDNDGRPRLELVLDTDGTPHLILWDEKNMLSGSMGLSAKHGSAGIFFMSSNAKHHINIGAHNDGVAVNFGDRPYEEDEDDDEPDVISER